MILRRMVQMRNSFHQEQEQERSENENIQIELQEDSY